MFAARRTLSGRNVEEPTASQHRDCRTGRSKSASDRAASPKKKRVIATKAIASIVTAAAMLAKSQAARRVREKYGLSQENGRCLQHIRHIGLNCSQSRFERPAGSKSA